MLISEGLHRLLTQWCGSDTRHARIIPVGGGSCSQVMRIITEHGSAFCCKLNSATKFPHLYTAEVAGLQQLSAHMQVPKVVGTGEAGDEQTLLLEWVDTEPPTPAFWSRLGEQLARMQGVVAPYFGAAASNYMGALPQPNPQATSWPSFLAQNRLLPLAEQACAKGLLPPSDLNHCYRLCEKLPQHFEPSPPRLVHGDLWSGNLLCNTQQQPVLIDPAAYYGHPVVDLGMTTVFGRFPQIFYEAYQYHHPLSANHPVQWELCNLYPLLVHLLLFGSGYYPQVQQVLRRYGR